ncbi:hypothetical protein TCON_0490 [Astathelohania contejeani]|uniref:Uncharacterized protein n=1 Tax=Astathelohania contejeani TaxID=164912 RepID=A0ABQ7I1N1_9MICR|nr:hypothetical protein TCON_0490 [Thelohania contejeani]
MKDKLFELNDIISKCYIDDSKIFIQIVSFDEDIKAKIISDIKSIESYILKIVSISEIQNLADEFQKLDFSVIKKLLLLSDILIVNTTLNLICNTVDILKETSLSFRHDIINEFLIIKDVLYKEYNFVIKSNENIIMPCHDLKLILNNNLDKSTENTKLINQLQLTGNKKILEISSKNLILRNLLIIQTILLKINSNEILMSNIQETSFQLLTSSFKEISDLISVQTIEWKTIYEILKLLKIKCNLFSRSKIEKTKLRRIISFMNDENNDMVIRGIFALFYSYCEHLNPELSKFLYNTFFISVISDEKDFDYNNEFSFLKNNCLITQRNYEKLTKILNDLLVHTIINFKNRNENYFHWVISHTDNVFFISNVAYMVKCVSTILEEGKLICEAISIFGMHLIKIFNANDLSIILLSDCFANTKMNNIVFKVIDNFHRLFKYAVAYNVDNINEISNALYSFCAMNENCEDFKSSIKSSFKIFLDMEKFQQKYKKDTSLRWISLILSSKPNFETIKNMISIISKNKLLMCDNSTFKKLIEYLNNTITDDQIVTFSYETYTDIFFIFLFFLILDDKIHVFLLLETIKRSINLYLSKFDVENPHILSIFQILAINLNLFKIMDDILSDPQFLINIDQEELLHKLVSDNNLSVIEYCEHFDLLKNPSEIFDDCDLCDKLYFD